MRAVVAWCLAYSYKLKVSRKFFFCFGNMRLIRDKVMAGPPSLRTCLVPERKTYLRGLVAEHPAKA